LSTFIKRKHNIPINENKNENEMDKETTIKMTDPQIRKDKDCETSELQTSEEEEVECEAEKNGRVPLAHGAIAHQPDSTRKIDTIPDSAPTR